jgi:hypothetical protein
MKNNLTDVDAAIERIQTFLKTTYPFEIDLLTLQLVEQQKKKSIQYLLLEEFQSTTSLSTSTSDIDKYFNTPPIQFKLSSENQTQWILNYWNTCKYEYPSMF